MNKNELYTQLRQAIEDEDLKKMEKLTKELKKVIDARPKPPPPNYSLRFEVSGDSIYDKKNNLTWKKDSLALMDLNFSAIKRIFKTRFGFGWRLPTKMEFGALIDDMHNPSVDLANIGFRVGRRTYWTSTQEEDDGWEYIWGVYLGDGTAEELDDYEECVAWAVKSGR